MNGTIYTNEKADEYIKNNKEKINPDFRPVFHFCAPCGWINDPNGFSYFNGKYHLFYQFHPYSAKWGPMHWGHAVSEDLIKWEHLLVALAPDSQFDKDGCFSGTAIVHEGKLYLMYTGVHDGKQEQCIAYSEDGINFEKYANNPVIGEKNLAPDIDIRDFRDPKILKRGDDFYCVVGANKNIAVYKSKDIFKWEYADDLLKNNGDLAEMAAMYECPDIFETGGKTVLISSVVRKNTFALPMYFILDLNSDNFNNLPVTYKQLNEIDSGMDFYAPQTVLSPENKIIMIAWMQAWGKSIPTDYLNHGWAGCMSIPREISVKNNRLYQMPVKAIEKYRKNEVKYKNISITDTGFTCENAHVNFKNGIMKLGHINGKCAEILMSVDMSDKSCKKFKISITDGCIIEFDKQGEVITLDRTDLSYDMRSDNQKERNERDCMIIDMSDFNLSNNIDLRIFTDTSTLEMYINNGEKVISSRIYPKNKDYDVSFASTGKTTINEIRKFDLDLYK